MRLFKYIAIALASIPMLVGGSLVITSCDDPDGMHIESPNGTPKIDYIRLSDPDASDSLIVSATLGTGIVLMGENLAGTREVWFNDRQASPLNPTWVLNNNVFVTVPTQAPDVVTNVMRIINADGSTLEYPFIVTIPPPLPLAAKNEWPVEDENLVITGDFFFEPITVEFTGGGEAEVVSISQTQLEVKVPAGSTEGPVTVTTNFGTTESTFHVWDRRNIIVDFDTKLGNGWRKGLREDTDGPVDGMYLVVRGPVDKNERREDYGNSDNSPLMMEYWGHLGDRPEGNLYPYYPNSYKDHVLKFEVKVKKWLGGYYNFVLAPYSQNNNSDVWNDPFVNARAIWGPWAADGKEYSTNGEWITVVIPLTEFKYDMGTEGADENVVYRVQPFLEQKAGSLSTWFLGSPESDGRQIEFFVDNLRIVEP